MRKKSTVATGMFSGMMVILILVFSQYALAQTNPIKVGVYDSRVVVMAYAGSPDFQQWKSNLDQKTDSAKKAGDKELEKKLGVEAMSFQHLLHQMCFSTASVSILLEPYKNDKIPALAKEKGLSVLVGKYELDFSAAGITTVDVTDEVVKFFINPTGDFQQKKMGIANATPVPLPELTIEEDMLKHYCTLFGK